jgi:hypothetical protein
MRRVSLHMAHNASMEGSSKSSEQYASALQIELSLTSANDSLLEVTLKLEI